MSKPMRTIVPGEIATRDLHQFLLGVVSPRPIAFVSTVDAEGNPNLAPYSFFNAFSSNPPILVFSSNRRVANNTTKDTLANIEATGECVINAVSHDIVQQMAIASVEFTADINEFEQAGLSMLPSHMVRPGRVAESPAHLECKVQQIIPLGDQGGAGHLIICHVQCMHVAEFVIDDQGRIDPHKIDLMGRMGRSFYVRASGPNVYPIVQEVTRLVIGFPALPKTILNSDVLTGNDLGRLAGLSQAPTTEEMHAAVAELPDFDKVLMAENSIVALHYQVKRALEKNNLSLAAGLAWYGEVLING